MDFFELIQRIEVGENLSTEFKEKKPYLDDLASEIIAFANTDGGQIFFGIKDNGEIIGIEENKLDSLSQFIDNVSYNNCEPPVTVVQETVRDEQGKVVLIANVPKGSQRPYRTNKGIYYVRTSSGRRQASREELLRLFQATESLYYDETPIMRCRLNDFSAGAMEDFFKIVSRLGYDIDVIPKDRVLANWHLTEEIKGEIYPTLSGVLLFAINPQKFIPYAYISAIRIPGTDIAIEPSDQKRIEGRLLDQLEDAMRFLEIHIPRPHNIKRLEPEVKAKIPHQVLREVLVNAMAHRDYTISAPVRIIVYDDRIEVRTPGKLPNTVTIEALRLGVHVLRNPTIYNIFLKLGLVTDAGSGIPRIISQLRKLKIEPVFKLEGNEFVVMIPY